MNRPPASSARSTLPRPDRDAVTRYARASAALRAGRPREALAAYDALLARAPSHADALNDSAIALAQLGRMDDAVARFERAVAVAPRSAEVRWNFGMLLGQLARFDDAIAAFAEALALNPAQAAWWTDLGNAHLAARRHDEALAAFDEALRRNPRDAGASSNRALALRALSRAGEAVAACRATLAIAPDRVDAWSNLGLMLMEADRLDEAADALDRAQALAPRNAVVRTNRCNLLLREGRRAEALAVAQDMVREPDAPVEAWNGLAHAQFESGLLDDALASSAHALAMAPANTTAQFSRAMILLMRGEYAEGFALYEARRTLTSQVVQARSAPGPEWDGRSLAGETVLLTAEQGAGDALQFIRYAALLKARGAARVVVEAPSGLASILMTAPGVDAVTRTDAPYPAYDLHAPLASLPRLFDSRVDTVPADVPYLRAASRAVAQRMRDTAGVRVGFVWSGNPRQNRNRLRSVPCDELLDALDVPGVTLFSLQVADAPEPALADAVRAGRVIDLAPELRSFSDTASAIMACDVVVSVCTSVAHLAGALARPTWTLLARVADWRWLRDRTDSPWYPTMRLFRQAAFDDWSAPLAEVRRSLIELAAGASRDGAAHVASAGVAHFERAMALRAQRDHAAALDEFERAVACDAETAQWWLEYARCAAALQQHGLAERAYDRALALDPRNATIMGDRAVTLRNMLRHDEAIAACHAALAIEPHQASIRSNLGVFLKELRRMDEAEEVLVQGLRGSPDHPHLLTNLATLYHESARLPEAQSLAERLVSVHPQCAEGYNMRGCLALEHGRYEASRGDLEHALALDPGHATAEWNLACLQLLTGDFAKGLRGLERRRVVSGFVQAERHLAGSAWSGGALDGQIILVHEEQGLGDVLQFVRYARELKRLGAARVVIETSADAARLVSTAPGVDEVVVRGESLPAYDTFVSLMSLPYHCGTRLETIPADVPYLTAQPSAAAGHVTTTDALKVGLVWGGNPQHQRDRYRSVPFPALVSAVQLDGVALYSLQKGPHAQALAPWRDALGIVDLDPHLATLDDTAAVLMALDLVVTVDTAVAHLAGALARPVWTLHPLLPDWRWGRDGDATPWYPTMRLFRQDAATDWSRPLGQLRHALQHLLASRLSR